MIKWMLFFLSLTLFQLIAERAKGRHYVGRRVTSIPEVARRIRYYKCGMRTYRLYTGGYSRA